MRSFGSSRVPVIVLFALVLAGAVVWPPAGTRAQTQPLPTQPPLPTASPAPAPAPVPPPGTTPVPGATPPPGATPIPAPGASANPSAPAQIEPPSAAATLPPIIVEPPSGGVTPGGSQTLRLLQVSGIVTVTVANPALVDASVDQDARTLARNVAPSEMERRTADRLKTLPKYEALFFSEGQRQPVHLHLAKGN